MAATLGKDFIDLKIDIDRMTHGKELALELRKTDRGGIPWMVILDADGTADINSDGPQGNIGCPVKPEERAHFLAMIEKSKHRMNKDDVGIVKAALEEFSQKILSGRKR